MNRPVQHAAEGAGADPLADWLGHTPLLSRFCTQNGWVDTDSLRYEVRDRDGARARINVHFVEIVMEGAGCVAGRVECFGQLDIETGPEGEVVGAKIV